jgi:hypothetical protein
MSNPTTPFGWQMPTATDLVTDLPADFEVFGQAVATSMGDLLGGTSGQVLAKNSNTDMDFVWVTSDDANAIQNTIVDAKGDLIAASASDVPARLAVGSNGETLVADSSTSTGLRYTSNFAAGKNKIINGDFGVNQRSFTSTTGQGVFGFDRFAMDISANTCTYSAQVFTPGTAPVAGYEGTNYARFVTAAQDATTGYSIFWQRIEDARTFAGQTATFSVWAKAASGTPKIALEIVQKFGSGGSTEVQTYAGQITLSTSWARYSITVAIPSVSGKTIGSGSSLAVNLWLSAGTTYNSRTGSLGVQNNTLELWGLQLEAGSVATAFQTATGTIQGELAACQRYYYRTTPNGPSGYGGLSETGIASSTTKVRCQLRLPVTMRVAPTSVDFSTLIVFDTVTTTTVTAVGLLYETSNCGGIELTVASGLTQYRPYTVNGNASTSAYLGFSAEL